VTLAAGRHGAAGLCSAIISPCGFRGLETGGGCSGSLFSLWHPINPYTSAAVRTAPSECSAPASPASAD